MHNGTGILRGAIENIKGNSIIANTLPAGDNKCIGAFEDAVENTIIYHVYNSLGNHRMFRYWPAEGRTDLLASGSELAYTEWNFIHSSEIVDKTLYYWTDGREIETGLIGNEPRKINLKKANNYQKLYEYEFQFALDDQFSYTTLTGTNFLVNGNTIAIGSVTTRKQVMQQVENELITEGYLVKTINNTLVFSSNVINTVITTTAAATWARLVPYNFYGIGDTKANHISLAKPMPAYAPTLAYISDTNGINNRTYTQYCIRYIYDDNEKSAWGTLSFTPHNNILSGYKTLVDFYDEKLNSVEWLTIIKRVEIGVKYGNTQAVRNVVVLDTSEIGFATTTKNIFTAVVSSNHYTHTDSTIGAVIGSDDNTSDNSTQVLKPYDNIPQLTHTICVISDENGSSLLTLSNNVDGRDNISTNSTVSVTTVSPIDMGDFLDPLPYYVTLKPYAEYDYGFVYYDKYGKFGTVQKGGTFFTTDQPTGFAQPIVKVRIKHTPPTWATHYQIVRTKDKISAAYNLYVNTEIFNDVTGISRFKIRYYYFADPFVSAASNRIYFASKLKTDFDLFQNGDRIRVYMQGFSGVNILDLKVTGYEINATGELFAITDRPATTLPSTALIEVYTPNTNKESFFYETGMKMPIIGGYHFGNEQTQTIGQDAIVELIGGDTKWSATNIATYSSIYYSEDGKAIENQDIGRLNIIDPNAKKQWYRSEIRFSERYNLHTYYNGLSAFRGLDYLETSDLFGSIQRVVNIQSGILVVCLYKIQPVYVNRDRLLDFNANQSIGRTGRILNIAEKVINDWGTRNPESIFVNGGHVYGFDAYNGMVWRYAQDGQTPISEYGRHIFFNGVGRNRLGIARITDKVITGYDKEHDKFYFTFKSEPESFTVGYEDASETKGWKGSYSFMPEMYANVNSLFFSFRNGILWQHNSNIVARCNFYGTQYTASVTGVFNPEPSALKVPKAIRVQSNNLFVVPLINSLPSSGYPNGQRSKLLQANKWFMQEGQFFAVVMNDYMDSEKRFRDITDPATREVTALMEGRNLKVEAATIQFQSANAAIQNRLIRADVEFFNSENTF